MCSLKQISIFCAGHLSAPYRFAQYVADFHLLGELEPTPKVEVNSRVVLKKESLKSLSGNLTCSAPGPTFKLLPHVATTHPSMPFVYINTAHNVLHLQITYELKQCT